MGKLLQCWECEEPAEAKKEKKAAGEKKAEKLNEHPCDMEPPQQKEMAEPSKNFAKRSRPSTVPYTWRFDALKHVWHERRGCSRSQSVITNMA